MIKSADKAINFTQMDLFSWGITKRIKKTEKGDFNGPTDRYMMDNGKMVENTEADSGKHKMSHM
jgi:hypothetical protein